MIGFLTANLATIIISAVLLLCVTLAVFKIIKDKKSGSSCSSCSGCSQSCSVRKD